MAPATIARVINNLPGDVLLDIFGSYMDLHEDEEWQTAVLWETLVHVCHRWRNLVFSSPRHLGLQLLCTDRTRVREMLHIWPALPIHINASYMYASSPPGGMDNIIATLENSSRVSRIWLQSVPGWVWERFTAAMQVPFPELTDLEVSHESIPVLPDSFLGGSAPRLRSLELCSVPPRKLLLSASHLVNLSLWNLHSKYILPDGMVACLSSLIRLETLRLAFQFSESRPDRPSPPPPTRVIVPVLAELYFKGARQYLEDLVAQIDAPLLNDLEISFFEDSILDIPHLGHFLSRTNGLNMFSAARVLFHDHSIDLELNEPHHLKLTLAWPYNWVDLQLQLSSLASICSQLSPFLSNTERLDLVDFYVSHLSEKGEVVDDVEATLFFDLFLPFTALQTLHVAKELLKPAGPALAALQELDGESPFANLRASGWALSDSDSE